MVDRRAFMKQAVGFAAALAAVPHAVAGPFAVTDVVLVDRGLEGSGSFAAKARARGLAPLTFSSDAAGVWMRELQPRLGAGPATIEGYTSAATLFCLALLARDYGAQVVQRNLTPDGVVWTLSSNPMRRAALAPLRSRSALHA